VRPPGLKQPSAKDDPRKELRQRLMRRLKWKVPLILMLVSFAGWWQWSKNQAQRLPSDAQGIAAKAATAIAGLWSGEVTYGWGDKHKEAFLFQPEGEKLFGTASFLASKRGIEDGKIEGESFSFIVRFQEYSGAVTQEHKNYYWGKLAGDEILMRLQDDRGSAPVDFVLRKTASAR
jgi:hypothetical protein